MDIENSTRGIMTAFFRQSSTFLLVFVIILNAGIAYVLMTKPVYEAKGSLVVKFGQDARPEASMSEQSANSELDSTARQEIIRSYIKIIFSRDMLNELVNDFGVYRLYPEIQKEMKDDDAQPLEIAVSNLMKNDVRVDYDQSHIIDVAVRNHDPLVAAEFAARLVESFIRRRTEIYNTPQTDFLQQQIDEARIKLESAQRDLQAFKQKAGISAIDEELEQLLREKSELSTVAYTAYTEAQAKLADLETREAEMRATYKPGSPMLTRLQGTIAVAMADLERRREEINGPSSTGSSLSVRLGNVDKRLAHLESQRGRFNELQQQVKINEENYLYYLRRGEEARINNLLNSQNITRIGVVDEPVAPIKPVKPKKSIIMAITLLAALTAAAGASLARELLDDRLSNPEQIYASLGIPVFASFEKESI